MTLRDLLQQLHDAGIILTVNGDRLKCAGPKGAMTAELRTAIVDLRSDIIYAYHERAGILEYDAGMPRDKAEEEAANMLNAVLV